MAKEAAVKTSFRQFLQEEINLMFLDGHKKSASFFTKKESIKTNLPTGDDVKS